LLIIEKNRRKEIQMETTPADSGSVKRAEIIIKLKIGTLICGVVGNRLFSLLEAGDIRVIPGVSGRVEEVIEAFFTGDLDQDKHTMPGCKELRRKRRLWLYGAQMKR